MSTCVKPGRRVSSLWACPRARSVGSTQASRPITTTQSPTKVSASSRTRTRCTTRRSRVGGRRTTPRCWTGCPADTRPRTAPHCTSSATTCTVWSSRAPRRARTTSTCRTEASSNIRWRRPISASDPSSNSQPPEKRPTILAMGGGGFTMEPENPALDDYVLALPGSKLPKICLLPTASGDGEAQIRQFHATFGARACEPMHISLFRLGSRPIPLRETLLAQDIVYVGGGSMLGLLAVWRALGLDKILRECWESGVVLAGLSAGAMCWFEWGVTSSLGSPAPSTGLGFLGGSMSVHMDGEPGRLPVFRDAVASGAVPAGYAAEDGVGLLFRGGELEEVVSSRPGRRALRVGVDGEASLTPRLLARGDRFGEMAEIAEFRAVRAMRR